MSARRITLAVVGLGLLGSQAGHLLAYQLRFGAAAQHVQSSGAHLYFPLVAKTTIGAVAAALVAAIFLIGLARVLAGRSLVRARSQPAYVGLLAMLYTFQLAFFVGQEMTESMFAGAGVDSAAHLLLWGTLGQLPVAAITALALWWLASRFEAALDEIRFSLAAGHGPQWPAMVAIPTLAASPRAVLLSQAAGRSLRKRGPPSSLRFSSY